jgi:hypothetical protein
MSGTDWDDLERAWQSLPATAQPVMDELKRRRRWRWLTLLNMSVEIALTGFGLGFGAWVAVHHSQLIGVIVLIYAALGGGLTYWARSIPLPRSDDAVAGAAAAAVRHAEIAVRIATACQWTVVAGMLFVAALCIFGGLGWTFEPDLLSIGLSLAWLAAAYAGSFFYRRTRLSDLGRFRAVQDLLKKDI